MFLTSFLSDYRDKGVGFSQLYRRLLLVLGSYISGHCTSCVRARTAKLVLTTQTSKEAIASNSELFFQNVVDYYVQKSATDENVSAEKKAKDIL